MMLGLDMRNKHKRQELLNLGREQNDYPEDTFLTEDEYAQEPEEENPHEQQHNTHSNQTNFENTSNTRNQYENCSGKHRNGSYQCNSYRNSQTIRTACNEACYQTAQRFLQQNKNWTLYIKTSYPYLAFAAVAFNN
jgi:hypothetical protein